MAALLDAWSIIDMNTASKLYVALIKDSWGGLLTG